MSVLDARTGAALRTDPVGQEPVAMAVDERTGHVIVAGSSGVSVLDARSGVILHAHRAESGPAPMAMGLDEAGCRFSRRQDKARAWCRPA